MALIICLFKAYKPSVFKIGSGVLCFCSSKEIFFLSPGQKPSEHSQVKLEIFSVYLDNLPSHLSPASAILGSDKNK